MFTRSRIALLVVAASLMFTTSVFAFGRKDLQAMNHKWEARADAGDAAGVAKFYAPDAQLLPPNATVVKGRAAIETFWKGLFDQGKATVKLETLEVFGSGDTVTDVGRYQLTTGDGKTSTGKYMVVWKKSGGAWWMYRDMWNDDAAPAAH